MFTIEEMRKLLTNRSNPNTPLDALAFDAVDASTASTVGGLMADWINAAATCKMRKEHNELSQEDPLTIARNEGHRLFIATMNGDTLTSEQKTELEKAIHPLFR